MSRIAGFFVAFRVSGSAASLVAGLVLGCFLAPSSAAASDFRIVDAAELHSMVVDNAFKLEGGRQRSFTIVDARSREAFAEAHVFSAINVPEAEFAECAELLPQDRSTALVVYGDGPERGAAARRWAEKAMAAGYRNVAVYSEDFGQWKERRMPVAPLRKDS